MKSYLNEIGHIIQCKSFRRLAHKMQVFADHETTNDHCRTRLTHTLEVAHAGRVLAKERGLNESLVEAICLTHDIGHPPFGHSGEDALNNIVPAGFNHNHQRLRVLVDIERLDLPYAILYPDGPEWELARWVDDATYIAHDIEDGLRCDILNETQLKASCSIWQQIYLQNAGREFPRKELLKQVREYALRADPSVLRTTRQFLDYFMYETENKLELHGKVADIMWTLWEKLANVITNVDERADYIAGMTDRYALASYNLLKD